MIYSTDRILTAHAGSLPRPDDLREMVLAKARGEPCDQAALDRRLQSAVAEIVKRQVECGLDSINDGEFGKQNFTSYVGTRISGYEPKASDPTTEPPPGASVQRDSDDFRAYYERKGALFGRGTDLSRTRLTCTGPLRYVGQSVIRLHRDQERLRGLRITYQAATLRHYTARLEELSEAEAATGAR